MKKSIEVSVALALTFAVLVLFCIWDRELKFLVLWALHLVPTAIIGVPLWSFARHRVSWDTFDVLIITLPFLCYLATAGVLVRDKSLANLVEPFLLGLCLPLSPLIRVIVGPRLRATKLSAFLLGLLCMLAIALYAFVPALPE